jgi:hypothetical protein
VLCWCACTAVMYKQLDNNFIFRTRSITISMWFHCNNFGLCSDLELRVARQLQVDVKSRKLKHFLHNSTTPKFNNLKK